MIVLTYLIICKYLTQEESLVINILYKNIYFDNKYILKYSLYNK